MLEIIIIWRLTVYIGRIAAQKGLKKIGYQAMAVMLWLSGEIFGLFLANSILPKGSSPWLGYSIALAGAVTGAGAAFLIMRFIPIQDGSLAPGELVQKKEPASSYKFKRSGWIPTLTILLSLSCLCIAFGGAVIVGMVSMVQQIHANNPIIGTEIDADGQISQPKTEVSSMDKTIYLSFYLDIPEGRKVDLTFHWFVDGHPLISHSETHVRGQVVSKYDRNQFVLSEFPKGNYLVEVRLGNKLLTSMRFTVIENSQTRATGAWEDRG